MKEWLAEKKAARAAAKAAAAAAAAPAAPAAPAARVAPAGGWNTEETDYIAARMKEKIAARNAARAAAAAANAPAPRAAPSGGGGDAAPSGGGAAAAGTGDETMQKMQKLGEAIEAKFAKVDQALDAGKKTMVAVQDAIAFGANLKKYIIKITLALGRFSSFVSQSYMWLAVILLLFIVHQVTPALATHTHTHTPSHQHKRLLTHCCVFCADIRVDRPGPRRGL
jgi:hypothetical protein